MRRQIKLGSLIAISGTLFTIWCMFFKMIAPGYVGVVVNLFGEDKGAAVKELKVGMHWVAPWKSVYKFPVFQQNTSWEGRQAFNFQTNEGMQLSAAMGVTFHLQEDKIHLLFSKYRRGLDEITDTFIHNYLRDAINKTACKFKIEDLYSADKQKFLDIIETTTRHDLESQGVIIDRIYIIGNLHFPDQVVTALNAKIEATQRAQQRENELREAKAQAEKEIAKAHGEAESRLLKSRAEADANLTIAKSLTPELVRYELSKKWNGQLPQVSCQTAMPMIDFGK